MTQVDNSGMAVPAPSKPKQITKEFKITTSPEVMERIERFFALLHWNSCFGHSGIFGMALDGDGWDKVSVSPKPEHKTEVDLIGGVGGDVECAGDNGFYCIFKRRDSANHWSARDGELRVNGRLHSIDLTKLIPYKVTRKTEMLQIADKIKELAEQMEK